MDRFALTAQQREEVAQVLRQSQDVRLYRRLLALLEVDRGRPVAQVARSLAVSRQSIYGWLHAYHTCARLEALAEQPRSGRPSVWDDELRGLLQEWLAQSPEAHGYLATTWTVPLLQEQLRHVCGRAIGENTLRRQLHKLGYSWKRSRYVLAPDPERGEKDGADPAPFDSAGAPERGAGGRRD